MTYLVVYLLMNKVRAFVANKLYFIQRADGTKQPASGSLELAICTCICSYLIACIACVLFNSMFLFCLNKLVALL